MKTIINSWRHIPYSWKHYLAFREVSKRLTGRIINNCHDWDKIVIFALLPFLGEKRISQWHRKYRNHHPTWVNKNGEVVRKSPDQINWTEAIIDWECARITKPDKPMDAYDTAFKFYPEYLGYIEPELKKLGLWRNTKKSTKI